MKNLISDKDFCAQIQLSGKAGKYFTTLVKTHEYALATLYAAEQAFSQSFNHPIVEKDIPAIATLIHKEIPEQIQRMEKLANNYWLKKVKPTPANASAYDTFHFHVPNTMQRARGIGVYSLSRLFHLTGKKKYLTGAMKMLRDVCAEHGNYPE
ncbi:MAG: hypothetical protein HRU15_17450, partial [Planctomycetes bacterium]|nr:hypothetical protein [Planctomycetota bacterium]